MPAGVATVVEAVWYADDASPPSTILKPAAFAAGELLIFVLATDGPLLSNLTAPTGWTALSATVNSSPQIAKAWYHVYDVADPSTWDFGYGAGEATAAGLFRITGADTSGSLAVLSAARADSGASFDCPTITPTSGNDLLLCFYSNWCDGTALTLTVPTGMTGLGQVQVAGNFEAATAAQEQLVSTSPTGVRTWTSIGPSTTTTGGFSIAVKSSNLFDPDPPRLVGPRSLPPAVLQHMLHAKQREFEGGIGSSVPGIRQVMSGAGGGVSVTLITSATQTAVGDLLVAFCGNDFYAVASLSAPTGTAGTWTLHATGDRGTDSAHMKAWSRPVTVAGAQTVTFAPVLDEEITAHLFVLTNADLTTPTDGAAGNSAAASASHVAPSVSPTTPGTLLLVGVQADSDVGPVNYTAPPGMFKETEVDVGGFCTGATASLRNPYTGATGTKTFLSSGSVEYATVSVAIRALAPVAPPPTTADDGVGVLALAGRATAVHVAVQTGRAALGLAALGTAVHLAPRVGVVSVGLAGSGAQTVAGAVAETGRATFGLAGQGAARKVVPQTGQCALGLAGQAAARKVTPDTGRAALGLAGASTARKVAPAASSATLAMAAAGTAVHKAPRVGTASAGFTAYGPTQGQRAQTGRAALGLAAVATALRKALPSAYATVALSGRGQEAHAALPVARGGFALAGRGTAVHAGTAAGRGVLGLHGYTAPGHLASFVGRASMGLAAWAAATLPPDPITYRPDTGDTSRLGAGTTTRPTGDTARPSDGRTYRPYTGDTS